MTSNEMIIYTNMTCNCSEQRILITLSLSYVNDYYEDLYLYTSNIAGRIGQRVSLVDKKLERNKFKVDTTEGTGYVKSIIIKPGSYFTKIFQLIYPLQEVAEQCEPGYTYITMTIPTHHIEWAHDLVLKRDITETIINERTVMSICGIAETSIEYINDI